MRPFRAACMLRRADPGARRADPGAHPGEPGPAHWWGHATSLEDEGRDFLLFNLRDADSVPRSLFTEIFGVEIPEMFGRTLDAWEREGIATLDAEALVMVPQERRVRADALLWLLPEVRLEREIAKRRGDGRR